MVIYNSFPLFVTTKNTYSKHNVDPTTLHSNGASQCRPAGRDGKFRVGRHIVCRANDCWSPPNDHLALPPLQSRPRQERPPGSPQGTRDVHRTFPEISYISPIRVLQQLLLLRPVLPVAVLQGKFNDEGGKFTEFQKQNQSKIRCDICRIYMY